MRRRNFIKAISAAMAGLGLPSAYAHSRSKRAFKNDYFSKRCDVVIIGAGLSGLVAARELMAQNVSTLIIEARERVGGRTVNQAVAGDTVVDGGGQWIGPTQTQITALAAELGIDTFKTRTEGETLLLVEGQRFRESEQVPSLEVQMDLEQAITKIDTLAFTVPLSTPWTAPGAQALDEQTVGSWLDANTTTADARAELEIGVSFILGAPSAQISLLWFLFYVHSAGGYVQLQAIRGGAQESRLVGGSHSISIKIADELGDRLILANPAYVVTQSRNYARVYTRFGRITAQRAIVAMMPADVERIAFFPRLPRQRLALQRSWATSSGFKVHVVYDSPFWRDDELSGQAITDTPVASVFDNSPRNGSPGVLLAFPDRDNLARDPQQRRQQILNILAQLFGEAAARPIDYVEMDWGNEYYTAGCVSPIGPGTLSAYGPALRSPIKRIHWAGAETSLEWNGYMEGAVRAGKRAAAEALGELTE